LLSNRLNPRQGRLLLGTICVSVALGKLFYDDNVNLGAQAIIKINKGSHMKTIRSILVENIVGNIILNFFIAYGLSSLLLASKTVIPMNAPVGDVLAPNMGGDILVGTFITGVLLTLILTNIVRLQYKSKPINITQLPNSGWSARLPESIFKRSLMVGIVSAMFIAMPVLIVMEMLAIQQASTANYILYHGVYVALLTGLMAYFVTNRAILDLDHEELPAK